MKTNSILTAIALTTVFAATVAIARAATPATPIAPAAEAAPASAAAPVSPTAAPTYAVNPLPAPNQIIYLPQLPTPATLINIAAAQGVSIEQINQTSAQITVVYKYANGQTNTVCYQLLQTVSSAPVPAGPAPAASPTHPAVIYGTPVPAYYYDPYYYPWPWYGPVSIGLGFGFRGGYFHGGGFHGGHGRH